MAESRKCDPLRLIRCLALPYLLSYVTLPDPFVSYLYETLTPRSSPPLSPRRVRSATTLASSADVTIYTARLHGE